MFTIEVLHNSSICCSQMHQKQASGSNFSDLAEPNGVVSPLLTSSIKVGLVSKNCVHSLKNEKLSKKVFSNILNKLRTL